MSVLVPGAEKQIHKCGIFGSDSRKESSTPAKSLYLVNVPELDGGKPVCISISRERAADPAGPARVTVWEKRRRPVHFVLFSL